MQDENWTICQTCGERRLIDPATGEPEPCAKCRSAARKTPLVVGIVFLSLAAISVLGLLVFALMLLNGY